MYERNSALLDRKFREYLIPTILTTAAISLANVMDSIIVGNLIDETALSAIGLASPIVFSLNALYFLFAIGGVTCASVARGKREVFDADRFFSLTFLVGIFAQLLLIAGILIFMRPITYALAQGDSELAGLVRDYITPLLFAGPIMMLIMGMAQFVRADGKPRVSAWISLIANGISLALGFVFIEFLDMGIAGAGLSTTLGFATGIPVVLIYLRSKERAFRFMKLRAKDFVKTLDVLIYGLPRALTQGLSFFRTIVLNTLIIGTLGAAGVAAFTVCANALMIAAIFINGTNDTELPIIGTLFGERDNAGIKYTVRRGFIFLMATCIAVTVAFLVFPAEVARIFGITTAEGISVATPALRIYALSLPIYALNRMMQNFFQTTGRAKFASILAVASDFVFVVIFAFVLSGINSDYIWYAFVAAEAMTLLFAVGVSIWIRKKEKVSRILLLKQNAPDEVFAEFSIPATVEASVGLSEKIIEFCRENGIDESCALKIGIAAEEMAVNTARYGGKKANEKNSTAGKVPPVGIDVFIRITGTEIILSQRDGGINFDPTHYNSHETEYAVGGIELVRRIAADVKYITQLGFNVTIINVPRTALKNA